MGEEIKASARWGPINSNNRMVMGSTAMTTNKCTWRNRNQVAPSALLSIQSSYKTSQYISSSILTKGTHLIKNPPVDATKQKKITSSPKHMMSTFTFSFFNLRASFPNSFSSKLIGDPKKTTIRVRWFFPCRCFKANYIESRRKKFQT